MQRNGDPILSGGYSWWHTATLKPEHIQALHEIVAEYAQASLEEIADELDRRCGLRVRTATIRRSLRGQGIVRLKETRWVSPTADKDSRAANTWRRTGAMTFPITAPT
ncbi:hypothetical protein ACFPOU_16915 [Massilia jejuensis]|uniref:Helix-turn-helix domain-containing protein n=1 Tax=Massilia jejuensis TaxID=648894 RepID=A0ABW0PM22_9BURK